MTNKLSSNRLDSKIDSSSHLKTESQFDAQSTVKSDFNSQCTAELQRLQLERQIMELEEKKFQQQIL